MAFTIDEKGKTTKTENKNKGHVALQGVPLWPTHMRPDRDRDKYGPLPNTKIPKGKA